MKRMEIVKPSWERIEYLGIKDMLNETVNQKSKDKTPIPNMASNGIAGSLSRMTSIRKVYIQIH